jgi:hypothetical protein
MNRFPPRPDDESGLKPLDLMAPPDACPPQSEMTDVCPPASPDDDAPC